MKRLVIAALLISTGIMWSCSGKKEDSAHDHEHNHKHSEDQITWKEMDDFHMAMAEAFHPYMEDSTNLEPAKTSATSLAELAAKWSSSTLPEKANTSSMKSKLDKLSQDAATFSETVKAGDDKAIGDQLTKLHDLFHEIQEEWYGGGEHHHHH